MLRDFCRGTERSIANTAASARLQNNNRAEMIQNKIGGGIFWVIIYLSFGFLNLIFFMEYIFE
jgi:hypothetical protein